MTHESPGRPQEMTCAYIQANAAGLAALAKDDPEARAAAEHCQECSSCQTAWMQGQQMLAWLDVAAQEPVPAEHLAHLALRVQQSIQNLEAKAAKWRKAVQAVVMVQAVALFAYYRPANAGVWGHTLLVSGLACAVLAFVLANGGRRAWLQGAAVLGAVSLGSAWTHPLDGALHLDHGFICLRFEVACAVVPWAIATLALRRGHFEAPQRTLAIHGMAGSLLGQAVLLSGCPVQASFAHVLAFHVLGLGVAGVMGWGFATLLNRFPNRVAA